MRKVIGISVVMAILLTASSLLVFNSQSDNSFREAYMKPVVLVSTDYTDCGLPGDRKGFIGWPLVILGSLDEQSCGGNSAMLYERFYPVGLASNLILYACLTYGAIKIYERVRRT
jgi:hypothetical protein